MASNKPKVQLKAIAPDGTVLTRTTNHPYTHVVAVKFPKMEKWGAWSWTSKQALAERTRSWLLGQPHTGDFSGGVECAVVEVAKGD